MNKQLYTFAELNTMHMELTDKCNAGCPMCPRYMDYGSKLNPNLSLSEVSLVQFKQWFPPEVISKFTRIFACGNYGDPIMARDCLDIYQYIRDNNDDVNLGINTNGSARSAQWWASMGKILSGKDLHNGYFRQDFCTFSIDGLRDTNHLYRRGTSFDKIISNMKSFVDAGGIAHWDFIVFRHNEHQLDEAKQLAESIGVKYFNVKRTTRWADYDENGLGVSPVKNTNGIITHYLRQPLTEELQDSTADNLKRQRIEQEHGKVHVPKINASAQTEDDSLSSFPKRIDDKIYANSRREFTRKFIDIVPLINDVADIKLADHDYVYSIYDKDAKARIHIDIRNIDICCRAQSSANSGFGKSPNNEMFLTPEGYVFPCCFLGGEPWKYFSLGEDGRSTDAFIKMLDCAGGMNSISLQHHSLSDIITHNKLYTEMLTYSFTQHQPVRSRQCSTCCGMSWNALSGGEIGNDRFSQGVKDAKDGK